MERLDPFACSGFLLLAFILAGLLHALWLRSAFSARFRVPIDGGHTLAGQPVFGANKTWRGFMMIVPATGAMFALLRTLGAGLPGGWPASLWPLSPAEYGLLGLWAGFGFMAGELPNSFCKRRLGIPPGAAPAQPAARITCFLCDRLDSIAGAFLALALVMPLPLPTIGCVVLVGPLLHWSFSLLLFYLGVKVRPA